MPAKSLCRFKCLSKSFMALLTNPRFIKLHQTQNQQRQSLVASGEKGLHWVDLDTKITAVDPLDFPIKKHSDDSVSIYGSCNGLLCLSIENESATKVNPLDIINLTVTAAFEFEEDKFKLLTPPHDDNYEYRKASLFNPTLHTGTQ
ncbi:hypothetical protein WN944_015795 [Citrus x changshan-huyou]|uniref:Uncharacterized protein n=1 Tax=Citrus x changshan-huyou TaxID=2935761 RepID=A0AAP0M9P9_9ROSI